MIYLKRILYGFSILFILLVSLVAFLLNTTPGLYLSIKLANLALPGKLSIQKGEGRLMNHFSFNELSYKDKTMSIAFQHGHLHWQLKRLLRHELVVILNADKLIVSLKESNDSKPFQLPIDLHINKLTINHVQFEQGDETKYIDNLDLQAAFTNVSWFINYIRADIASMHFDLQGSGQSMSPYTLSTTLKFRPLALKSPYLQGSIHLEGDTTLYRWQGQFSGLMHGNLIGTFANKTMDTTLNWDKGHLKINAQQQGDRVLINSTLHIAEGNVHTTATYEQKKLDAQVVFGANTMHLRGYFPYQWQAKLTIPQPARFHPSLIGLDTTLLATLTMEDMQHASAVVTVQPGVYRFPQESSLPPLKFKGGQLSAKLTPKALQTNGLFTIDPMKIINVALDIQNFQLNEMSAKHHPMSGKVNVQINSLDFLQEFSKDIEHLHGQLQMNLTAKGTFAQPILQGELSLKNGSIFIPKLGQIFSPIQVTLFSKNKQWQAQGSITTSNKIISLKGQGNFSPKVTGQLTIAGDNVPILKTENYNVNISPQLAINITPATVNVTGTVLIPSAQFKPISFSNTVSLSEDVVFVKKESASQPNPLNINTDIQLQMGKDVTLDVKGLHGYLDGSLRIKQAPKSVMTAIGELQIREGKYRAYGQDLIIEQGQVLFTGGPIDNPALRIRAIRKFSGNNFQGSNKWLDFSAGNMDTVDIGTQTTVGIELSGRINAHKITLFSIPATLSQSDILSLLILGKPANQASKAGGQLLLAAISSMNLDSGAKGLQLVEQLKQSLGIDINLQNDEQYNQTTNQANNNTSLVVTKSIAKRVFLSYNMGLLQKDSSVIILKYLLNRYFSIQVTASDTGNGLDLLYTKSAD